MLATYTKRQRDCQLGTLRLKSSRRLKPAPGAPAESGQDCQLLLQPWTDVPVLPCFQGSTIISQRTLTPKALQTLALHKKKHDVPDGPGPQNPKALWLRQT